MSQISSQDENNILETLGQFSQIYEDGLALLENPAPMPMIIRRVKIKVSKALFEARKQNAIRPLRLLNTLNERLSDLEHQMNQQKPFQPYPSSQPQFSDPVDMNRISLTPLVDSEPTPLSESDAIRKANADAKHKPAVIAELNKPKVQRESTFPKYSKESGKRINELLRS